MRFRRVGRLGTTGALTAAALGASIVFIPSSASAASDWKCYGTAVKRCATVWWDQAADTFRAQAKITDVAGGAAYQVKVIDVKLQRTDKAEYVTVRSTADHDGWHDTEDLANTTTVDPCSWKGESFSVVATFSWKGASSGEKTWRPNQAWGHLCA
ncbi:hypothetical protein [Streptomyces atroolivaceus]|uniref:hypothetical protein n=1 Tax=Streptomyces atroolivaceus TaxID=66869 RepID=UPI00379BC044